MIVKAYALNDRTLKFCKINSIWYKGRERA
jgi:hypothetical protein